MSEMELDDGWLESAEEHSYSGAYRGLTLKKSVST